MILTPALEGLASPQEKVAANVPRWLKEIPLYQNRSVSTGRGGDESRFWDGFRKLPTMTKREIQAGFPHNFLRPGIDLDTLISQELVEVERTSGTSENAVSLLLERGWWDRQEQSAFRLNAFVAQRLSSKARRVSLVSPMCSSELSFKGIPSKLDRIIGQSLFVNLTRHPFLWSDLELERMSQETAEWEPLFLDVDPVYGTIFALYCERQGVRFPSLRFIISSYEFLSLHHRRIMERVFQVPVFNLYGSTETGHLLMEDENGRMVPSHSTAYLELIETDSQGIGKLVVTTLENEYMPLIRYDIGDLARAVRSGGQTHYQLHGRARDALITASGHRVTVAQVDECTRPFEEIMHYQLRQVGTDRYCFYYVRQPSAESSENFELLNHCLSENLQTRNGVGLVACDFLLPESSGKFRLGLPVET